jgi:hypothetical protein
MNKNIILKEFDKKLKVKNYKIPYGAFSICTYLGSANLNNVHRSAKILNEKKTIRSNFYRYIPVSKAAKTARSGTTNQKI